MFRNILLALLLPASAAGQQLNPVEQVISQDYLQSVQQLVKTKSVQTVVDSAYLPAPVLVTVVNPWELQDPFKKLAFSKGTLEIKPKPKLMLVLGGNYFAIAELKIVNRLPQLQHTYVQGRNDNGALLWRGAETNEMFSYGPAVQTLEFDGAAYPYDVNGRLTNAGTGNGKPPSIYNNSIFRTGSALRQSFKLEGNVLDNYRSIYNFYFRINNSFDQTFIQQNQNRTTGLQAGLGAMVFKAIGVRAVYQRQQEKFSNSSRYGILNRAFQNAMLTPISFSNSDNYANNDIQKSYSNSADNSLALLGIYPVGFSRKQERLTLQVEKKTGNFKFNIAPVFSSASQQSFEGYPPATAFFINGIQTIRSTNDRSLLITTGTSYSLRPGYSSFRFELALNHIFSTYSSSIGYSFPALQYQYNRRSYDGSLQLAGYYSIGRWDGGLELGNKAYHSSTVRQGQSFLPSARLFARLPGLWNKINIKIVGSYNQSASVLPVNRSFGYNNLLRLNTSQWQQYFPLREVNTFNGLAPVHLEEWLGKIEIWGRRLSFVATAFIKNTRDDILPVWENDALLLRNIASHRNTGFELEFHQYEVRFKESKFSFANSISFCMYRNVVRQLTNNLTDLPVAGFSNVNKALVKDFPIGSIVGNAWLRDDKGNRVIGADGFPLVDNSMKILGNPIPDFVVKLNNRLKWKVLTLCMDWEWQKGGDIWNGTRAVLDYYGRSAQSAKERKAANVVFEGVLQNGHVNNIPVSFYQPGLPLDQNRWVRYGITGVAEDYIEKAHHLRINSLELSFTLPIKKYLQQVTLSAFVNNLLLWAPYRGVDPSQHLYDQPELEGLDFFTLPSTTNVGISINLKF